MNLTKSAVFGFVSLFLTMSRAGIEPAMHNLGREEKVNVYQPALNKVHRFSPKPQIIGVCGYDYF